MIPASIKLERVRTRSRHESFSEKPFHVWEGSYSDFLALVREHLTQDRKFSDYLADLADDKDFSGIDCPRGEWLASGLFPAAVRAFDAAVSRLHADRLNAGTPRPMVAGGAWIVPLVLANNPLPARIRERNKLPPIALRVGVTVPAYRKAEDLANSLAALAHGAWEYIQAGGAVTLDVWHSTHYDSPARDGAQGLVCKVRAPLTSKAAFACAASVQLKRGVTLSLANSLRGMRQSLPMCYVEGVQSLTGDRAEDAKALEALRVRG